MVLTFVFFALSKSTYGSSLLNTGVNGMERETSLLPILVLLVVQVSISFSTEIVLSSERRNPKYNSTKRAEEASLSLCSIQKSTSFFSSSRVNAKRIASRTRNAAQKVALRKEIAALEAERVALQRLLSRLAERYAVRHEGEGKS